MIFTLCMFFGCHINIRISPIESNVYLRIPNIWEFHLFWWSKILFIEVSNLSCRLVHWNVPLFICDGFSWERTQLLWIVLSFPFRDECHHFTRRPQRKSHGNTPFTSCEDTSSIVGSVRYVQGLCTVIRNILLNYTLLSLWHSSCP